MAINPAYIGGPPPPPRDGTEGTATITLTLKDPEDRLIMKELIGCVITNSDSLWDVILHKHTLFKKHQETKFFIYFCYFQQNWSNQAVNTEINVHRYTKPGKDKSFTILNGKGESFFLWNQYHAFLPACDKSFNNSKFLGTHSKQIIGIHQISNGKYKGITKVHSLVKFVEITIESHNNRLVLQSKDCDIFNKLVDGPLLYDNQVVGYYVKVPDCSKITVHLLATKDAIDVWKASVFHQSATESGDSTNSTNQETTPQSTLGNRLIADIIQRDSSYSSDDNRDVSNEDPSRNHASQANKIDNNIVDVIDDAADDDVKDDADEGPSKTEGDKDDNDGSEIDNGDDHQTFKVKDDSNEGTCQTKRQNDNGDSSEFSEIDNGDGAAVEDDSDDGAIQAEGDSIVGKATSNHTRAHAGCSDSSRNSGYQDENDDDSEQEVPSNNYQDPVQSGNIASERSMSSAPIEEQGFDAAATEQWRSRARKVTFCKLYEYDSSVVQDLGKIFDKKSITLKSVTYLADQVGADPLIKYKCNSIYNHSPASELLDLPLVSMRPIQELVKILREIQKEQIASLIETKVESQKKENEKEKTIEDFFLVNFELKEKVTAKLEGSESFDWRCLGNRFGVDAHKLDQIERGTNPAESFLVEYAYRALPKSKLQLDQFLAHMSSLGRRDEILKLFKRLEITQDEYSKSMKDVFKRNTVKMDELCKLLNKKNCNGWQRLAVLWDVDELTYSYYIPHTKASATRILFDWLMMQRPDFTVFSLCEIFRNMSRQDAYDVLTNKLSRYYQASLVATS